MDLITEAAHLEENLQIGSFTILSGTNPELEKFRNSQDFIFLDDICKNYEENFHEKLVALPKEVPDRMRRKILCTYEALVLSKSKIAAFFFSPSEEKYQQVVANAIRPLLPNLKIVIGGQGLELTAAIEGLLKNRVDLVIRSNHLAEFVQQLHRLELSQIFSNESSVIWKDQQGLIHFNERAKGNKTDSDCLFVVTEPCQEMEEYQGSGQFVFLETVAKKYEKKVHEKLIVLPKKIKGLLRQRILCTCEAIINSKAKTVAFFYPESKRHYQQVIATEINKIMPDLKIIFGGPGMNFEFAVDGLRKNRLNLIIRTDKLTEFAQQVRRFQSDQDFSDDCLVLWKDKDGLIQFNQKEEEAQPEKNVLLVLMPAWNNDFPPFGLAHIKAALQNAGHGTDVLDLNWHFWQQWREKMVDCSQYANVLLWINEHTYQEKARPHLNEVFQLLKKKIESGRYKYVGFSMFNTNQAPSRDAFDLIRKWRPNIKIFCGGPGCTTQWAEGLLKSKTIDAAVFGEGEVSAVDLINSFSKETDDPVAGVARITSSGEILKGPSRPLTNINTLPYPDFSGFSIYNYDEVKLPVYFSRGCVARCTFCEETQYWVRFRLLSPERVVESMKRAINSYGISQFIFADSLMNGSHKHLEKLMDMILEQKLKVSFHGYGRLDGDLTLPLLKKMAQAGCHGIAFGMETGSQKLSELMNKDVKVQNYVRIIKDASSVGIKPTVCVIVGFPGETWGDFFKTALLIFRLRNHIRNMNLSVMSLAHISTVRQDLAKFGVHPDQVDIDRWKTMDGKNNPTVRLIRYWCLKTIWHWFKKSPASPRGWNFRPA